MRPWVWSLVLHLKKKRKEKKIVAHACNLSYLDCRDQDCSRSQSRVIVLETLSWKHPTQKRAGGVAQVVECLPGKHWNPEFEPQYWKKKKREKKIIITYWGCSLVEQHVLSMWKHTTTKIMFAIESLEQYDKATSHNLNAIKSSFCFQRTL
jgi:hypothetical protein